MDWIDSMNAALNYIEESLESSMDYEMLAKQACCSSYHFQRMFSFIAGIPLSEYIRKRRMTKAAFDLQQSHMKVIDCAIKYGYESPNSFARAFQTVHGITPSEAKREGSSLKAYPRISFQISIKGDVEMNYRIEKMAGFRVYGIEKVINMTNGCNLIEIPAFWQESFRNGVAKRIESVAVNCSYEGLGKLNAIMCYKETEKDTFPYMIGLIDFDQSVVDSKDLQRVDIPSYTWAIFKTEIHASNQVVEKIQTLWGRIFGEWFPTSGFEHDLGPELELYYMLGEDRDYSEVWIPVIKK